MTKEIEQRLAARTRPRAASRTTVATLELENLILEGTFRPGERLDETGLADRFGVSRTPVREALKSLAAVGLVKLLPNRRVAVASLDVTEMIETLFVIGELDAAAAALVARQGDPELVERIAQAEAACREAETPDHFHHADVAFHATIRQCAGNRMLAAETDRLVKRVRLYRLAIGSETARIARSNDEHAAIVAAIRSHDDVEAARIMRHHLHGVATDWRAAMQRQGQDSQR